MNKKKLLKLWMIFIMILLGVDAFAEWQSDKGDGTFKNPPMYADYPDPSMIRVGDEFYLATSSFVNVPGLVICKSRDMVNWEIAGHCISSFPSGGVYDLIGGDMYGNGCFAPSIAYKNGTFYVVVTVNGANFGTRIYYADDVAGPWRFHQLNGSYFDPCLFIEDDGTPYLAWGGAWQDSIRMVQLSSDLSSTVGSERVIISYDNIEGTHLSKVNGTYYLFNAVPARRLVCSRSSNLWGPYGETVTLCTAGSGGHQGGIVDLPDGSYWGYLHQDDGAVGRMTRICPITWENNWPRFGRSGNLGKVEASYTKPIQNQPVKVPAASDEFNGSALGLQWMWNHNPDNSKWSLTGTSLRLRASTASNFWKARNSLIQKGQGAISTGSIKVNTSAMQSGDIGGLGMLGDPHAYVAVAMNPKRIIMSLEDRTQATVSDITASILYFRVEMNFETKQAKFYWKDDSSNWQQIGPAVTMGFDWQYGTFQGEQYAILCFNPSSSSGYMDVDWFRLDDKPGPGELSPTPTPMQEPVWSGGPYTLNGTSDYVDLPDGLTNDLRDFSVACWVNLNTRDAWSRIFDFGNDSNIFMMLTPESGTTGFPCFALTISGNSGEQTINGTSALPTGSWQHLAVVKSGDTGTLYINGEEAGRNEAMTLTPAHMGNTVNNYIGRSQWAQDPYLNGEVDGFVFYNRAIDTTEVKKLSGKMPGEDEPGDVNGSGTIDIVDALMIAQYYVGLNPEGFIEARGDVNCDEEINIIDALQVAQFYVGLLDGFCL